MDGELIIFPRAGLLTFEINLRSKGAAETNGNDNAPSVNWAPNAPRARTAPGDAGEFVGERDRQHVAVKAL